MKKIISTRRHKRTVSSMVTVVNAIIFLVDIPGDVCEWFLKTIEVIAFLAFLLVSWNWNIRPMLQSHFPKRFRLSNFLTLKK